MSELPPASGSYAQHDAGQTIRLTGWTLKPTDPYTELRVLGKGATGVVLVARHEPSGQLVAIKRLAPSLAADPRFISEFRREFEVLRGLRHPNIAAVHWFTDQGAPVICMQLVDGVGLDMLLERGGALGAEAALALLSGSLQGLEHAHRAGIVHRDYKPANVVVDQRGTSSLVDFGVAVRSGQVTDPVGTPRYMAPEQWTSGAVGPQTDVYATTAVFFEVLTGHRPYAGATLTDLRNQHLGSPIPYQEAPPPLQNLIWRGLAKSPEQRYPTAGAFLEELRQAAASGYGPDWERRGAAVLVGAVAAAAALLPLALVGAAAAGAVPTVTGVPAAGIAAASAPAAPGAGAGATAAGHAGAAAAKGGIGAAKLAALAIGSAVVIGGATVGTLAATRSGPFAPSSAPIVAVSSTTAPTPTPTPRPTPTPTPAVSFGDRCLVGSWTSVTGNRGAQQSLVGATLDIRPDGRFTLNFDPSQPSVLANGQTVKYNGVLRATVASASTPTLRLVNLDGSSVTITPQGGQPIPANGLDFTTYSCSTSALSLTGPGGTLALRR